MNRIELIGNLGADPKIEERSGGANKATARIAVTERWSSGGEHTEWINLCAWGPKTDRAHEWRTGDLIYLTGRIRSHTYDRSGTKTTWTEVLVDRWYRLEVPARRDRPMPDRTPSWSEGAHPIDHAPPADR